MLMFVGLLLCALPLMLSVSVHHRHVMLSCCLYLFIVLLSDAVVIFGCILTKIDPLLLLYYFSSERKEEEISLDFLFIVCKLCSTAK